MLRMFATPHTRGEKPVFARFRAFKGRAAAGKKNRAPHTRAFLKQGGGGLFPRKKKREHQASMKRKRREPARPKPCSRGRGGDRFFISEGEIGPRQGKLRRSGKGQRPSPKGGAGGSKWTLFIGSKGKHSLHTEGGEKF